MIEPRPRADGTKAWRVRLGGENLGTYDTKGEAAKVEAEAKLRKARERVGMETDKGPITYFELVALWESNFQPSDWDRRMLKHSLDRWGTTHVRSIQPEAIGSWLHSQQLAPKTKTHILRAMRRVLAAGVEWGYLQKSPARPGAFQPPGEKRTRPITPFETWSEVELVADAFSGLGEPEGKPAACSGALVRFLCATGVRCPGEFLEARWGDVDFARREMFVRGTKNENAPRTIPLSEKALEALQSLPRGLQKSARIFTRDDGRPFNYQRWRSHWWRQALDVAELEHRSPYECRHTFATLALSQGAAIDDVASMLGHEDVQITFRYYRKWIRPMAERLRGILDEIGKEQDETTSDERLAP